MPLPGLCWYSNGGERSLFHVPVFSCRFHWTVPQLLTGVKADLGLARVHPRKERRMGMWDRTLLLLLNPTSSHSALCEASMGRGCLSWILNWMLLFSLKKQNGMALSACNPSSREAGAEGFPWVLVKPGLPGWTSLKRRGRRREEEEEEEKEEEGQRTSLPGRTFSLNTGASFRKSST